MTKPIYVDGLNISSMTIEQLEMVRKKYKPAWLSIVFPHDQTCLWDIDQEIAYRKCIQGFYTMSTENRRRFIGEVTDQNGEIL